MRYMTDRLPEDDLRGLAIYVTQILPYPGQQYSGLDKEICARRQDAITKYAQIRCSQRLTGRYVVVKRTLNEAKPLTICEMAAFGQKGKLKNEHFQKTCKFYVILIARILW